MLVGAAKFPMFRQMKPPWILPMDSRLMPRSRARADAAQTHRFQEFLQAPRQPGCQADFKKKQAKVRMGFIVGAVAGLILFCLLGSFRANGAGLHGGGLHEDLAALVDGDGLRGGLLAQFSEDGGVFDVGGEVGVLGGIGLEVE